MDTVKTKGYRIIAIALLFFIGFWAIIGGLALIADPTGVSLQIPLEFLTDATFDDYLIPGIILFLANGISSVFIGISVVRKVKNYPFFIMVQGTVLIFWLTSQLIINMDFYTPHLHITCYVIGLLLLVLGVIIKVPKEKKAKPLEL